MLCHLSSALWHDQEVGFLKLLEEVDGLLLELRSYLVALFRINASGSEVRPADFHVIGIVIIS